MLDGSIQSNSDEHKYSILSLSSFEPSHMITRKESELYDLQSGQTTYETGKYNVYRKHYFKNPCVPVDMPTIQDAIDHCPRGGTITILPGAYFENIHCINKDHITIRAAFPHIGAALIHHEKSSKSSAALNNPAILVSGASSNVTISHLQALHSSPGIDIWSGNCVVHCDDSACLHLHHSSLQSDSGRGVVVTGGSQLILSNSVLHDCAATGLYVGDLGTQGFVYGCNIIENGFGSARHLSRERRRLTDNDLHSEEEVSSSDEAEHENEHPRTDVNSQRQRVPPGHSGMYVETARAIIHDSMISGNSLTGLSVVRQGTVQLSGSDLTENGAEPVTVEDIPPFGHWGNELMSRGGIFFGPAPNNFTNTAPFGDIVTARGRIPSVALNEKNRFSPFHDTISQSVTISKLKKKYMKKCANSRYII